MDGNDLGMIARVFMFLLKGLKYVLKLVWFTGLWWFCVPLVVGIGTQTMGRLQYYQAEAEARRQLDTALKQEAQTRERNRTHDRDRGI